MSGHQKLANLIDEHRGFRRTDGRAGCYACLDLNWPDFDGHAEHLATQIAAEFVMTPAVGYVVLAKRPSDVTPGKTNYRTPAPIFHRDDRVLAEYSLRAHRDGLVDGERTWHGQCDYVLGEIREVQP